MYERMVRIIRMMRVIRMICECLKHLICIHILHMVRMYICRNIYMHLCMHAFIYACKHFCIRVRVRVMFVRLCVCVSARACPRASTRVRACARQCGPWVVWVCFFIYTNHHLQGRKPLILRVTCHYNNRILLTLPLNTARS